MGAHISAAAQDTRAVLDSVRRIVQTLHESSRRAERHVGLTGAQLFVLQNLADSPDLSLNELAARTRTHQSSVSTVVTRLVERRFVVRSRSAADARRIALRLTARGRRLIDAAPDVAQARLIRAIERLPIGRRRALARSLDALTRAMALADERAVMFFDDRARHRRSNRRD
jgi:MarR family transcriptional regulator, lower aerobic nicotinate degradation pathway regulator